MGEANLGRFKLIDLKTYRRFLIELPKIIARRDSVGKGIRGIEIEPEHAGWRKLYGFRKLQLYLAIRESYLTFRSKRDQLPRMRNVYNLYDEKGISAVSRLYDKLNGSDPNYTNALFLERAVTDFSLSLIEKEKAFGCSGISLNKLARASGFRVYAVHSWNYCNKIE